MLPALNFSRENPVNSPVLEQCGYIGPALRFGFQITASDCAQAVSGPDYASVQGIEMFMRNPDAGVDHGSAQQITSGPWSGANNDLGADPANWLIEGFAVNF